MTRWIPGKAIQAEGTDSTVALRLEALQLACLRNHKTGVVGVEPAKANVVRKEVRKVIAIGSCGT